MYKSLRIIFLDIFSENILIDCLLDTVNLYAQALFAEVDLSFDCLNSFLRGRKCFSAAIQVIINNYPSLDTTL